MAVAVDHSARRARFTGEWPRVGGFDPAFVITGPRLTGVRARSLLIYSFEGSSRPFEGCAGGERTGAGGIVVRIDACKFAQGLAQRRMRPHSGGEDA